MVAQLSSNRTSANGNAIRQGSRSSESREKWLNSRATRALGTSASAKKSAVSSMGRLLPIRGAHRIILLRQGQIRVNLSSQPGVVMAGILHAGVGMVDETRRGTSSRQRHVERFDSQARLEMI